MVLFEKTKNNNEIVFSEASVFSPNENSISLDYRGRHYRVIQNPEGFQESLVDVIATDCLGNFYNESNDVWNSSLRADPYFEIDLSELDLKVSLNEKNPENECLVQTVSKLVDKQKIYWVPHFGFSEANGPFPHEEVNILDPTIYGSRDLVLAFPDRDERYEALDNQYNQLFEWLNTDNPHPLDHVIEANKVMFMNCVDFIYISLHAAGLVTKSEILAVYNKQRANDCNIAQDQNFYYGALLHTFTDFDPETSDGQPGDILIAVNKDGNPCHMMMLDENKTQVGLWMLQTGLDNAREYYAARNDLTKLQNCYTLETEESIRFKHCPLDVFLSGIK